MFNDTEMGKEIHANEVLLNRVRVPSLKEELSKGKEIWSHGHCNVEQLDALPAGEDLLDALYHDVLHLCKLRLCSGNVIGGGDVLYVYTS